MVLGRLHGNLFSRLVVDRDCIMGSTITLSCNCITGPLKHKCRIKHGHRFIEFPPRKYLTSAESFMQYITSDSDSCFQVFHVVVEMVLKESGDKEIAVIIALLLAQSYWHSYFDTGVDQIVR